MAKRADAKRSRDKHAKEKKRQKRLAVRESTANRSALDRWKPKIHGIEGLARLQKIDAHDAAELAEQLAARSKDARVVWIPSRVRALSTEALLGELAARGVSTDEGAFVALAAGYESARKLAAERWHPVATATVHDRDLFGQAAEELWTRWLPDTPADEALRDRWRDALDRPFDRPEAAVHDLVGLLDAVGLERVARAGGDVGAMLETLDLSDQISPPDDLRRARVDRVLRSWQASRTVGTAAWEDASLLVARRLGFEEGVVEALDRIAEDPTNEALLGFAHEELCYDEPGPLHARLEAAYEAAIAATDGEVRERLVDALAVFREGPDDDDFDEALAEAFEGEFGYDFDEEFDEDEEVETPP